MRLFSSPFLLQYGTHLQTDSPRVISAWAGQLEVVMQRVQLGAIFEYQLRILFEVSIREGGKKSSEIGGPGDALEILVWKVWSGFCQNFHDVMMWSGFFGAWNIPIWSSHKTPGFGLGVCPFEQENGPLQVNCLKLNHDVWEGRWWKGFGSLYTVNHKWSCLFNTRQDQLTWLLANVNESIYLIAKKSDGISIASYGWVHRTPRTQTNSWGPANWWFHLSKNLP